MDNQLFDWDESRKSFIEPFLTPQERAAKLSQQPKLNEITGDNQKDTSRAAALSARPGFKGLKQQIVLCLENHPKGMTCSEICAFLSKEKPSCSPRLTELENLGVIYASGTRLSNLGSLATIYKLKEYHD